MPIGWTVSDSPSATTRPCSSPKPRRHRGRDQEQDQPEVGEQRRHLRVLVAVAVEVARAVRVGRLADAEAVAAQDGARRPPRRRRPSPRGRAGAGRSTARAGRPGCRDTPRHSRGVRSSVQTTIEMTSTTSADAEPRRAEDREDAASRSSDVDDAGAEDRVVAGVELVHRGRVVAGRAEREVGQLLDRHPDDREQRQEDDLDDREVDRREQAPQRRARAGRADVRPDGRLGAVADDGRCSRWLEPLDGAERPGRGRSGARRGRRPGRPRSRPAGPRGPRARPSTRSRPGRDPGVGELGLGRAGDATSTAGGRPSCGRCRARRSARAASARR